MVHFIGQKKNVKKLPILLTEKPTQFKKIIYHRAPRPPGGSEPFSYKIPPPTGIGSPYHERRTTVDSTANGYSIFLNLALFYSFIVYFNLLYLLFLK